MFKKLMMVALMLGLLGVAGLVQPVLACDIVQKADKAAPVVGDVFKVTVSVTRTHFTCTLPIEATEFKLTNLKLISQTAWTKTGANIWQAVLTVKALAAGDAVLQASRSCVKPGEHIDKLLIKVK
jgi:hypothetical protein